MFFQQNNVEDNIIGDKSCKSLSKASWEQLRYFDCSKNLLLIGNNGIGYKGINYLVKAKMPKLEKGSKAEEELARKQFKFNKALQLD